MNNINNYLFLKSNSTISGLTLAKILDTSLLEPSKIIISLLLISAPKEFNNSELINNGFPKSMLSEINLLYFKIFTILF